MRIESPTLGLDERASEKTISCAVLDLKGKDDPFLILSRDSMTYMQTVWTADGFIIEYQDGSISEHYVGDDFLSADTVTVALTGYLNGNDKWRSICSFHNKGLAGPTWNFGYFFGRLVGNISALFRRS